MTVQVVSYILAAKEETEKFKRQLVLQCAPLLKGVKRANALLTEAGNVKEFPKILEGTAISYRILGKEEGKCFVLLYRSSELERYLNEQDVLEFLKDFGYERGSLERMLDGLSRKIQRHRIRGGAFPHELGVFLDYPLSDVKGFIKSRGRNEALSGYWKVYDDPKKAGFLFRMYDWAKVSAVNEWLMGKSVGEIAR